MPIAALPPMQAAPSPVNLSLNTNDPLLAKDAIIAWFRGEFAAANAIIDALCAHLSHLGGGYDGVFEAVHRRRMSWIPVLQMQKYYSIADVTLELDRVKADEDNRCFDDEVVKEAEEEEEEEAADDAEEPNSDITDSGK